MKDYNPPTTSSHSLFSEWVPKIKKFFLSLNWQRRHIFAVLFLFIILGLAIPIFSAQAFVMELAWEIITFLPRVALSLILFFAVAITASILQVSTVILGWVTSPNFITFKFTENPFVTPGWEMVRDLTNMGFIIALVFIGLATSLRLGEYEVRKTLPRLIMIALLINFTPVITGLIIDFSNIIMNFFLSGFGQFSGFVSQVSTTGSALLSALFNLTAPEKDIAALVQGIMMIFFNLIAALVFFLFAILFVARYVALWTLIILSPIAFFCYILPGTRRAWSSWWNKFTQWCLIGIIGAFFLYLGELMVGTIMGRILKAPEETGLGLMNNVLPFLLPLVFLIFGFFITISTAPAGASFAISGAKKGAFWLARRRPVQMALSSAGQKIADTLTGTREKSYEGLKTLEATPGRKAWVAAKMVKPFIWATRGTEALVAPYLREQAAILRRYEPPKGWDQMSRREQENYTKSLLGIRRTGDRVILLSKMAEKGNLQKASDEFKDEAWGWARQLRTDVRYRKEVGDVVDALPDKLDEDFKVAYEASVIIDKDKRRAKREEISRNIDKLRDEFEIDLGTAAQVLHISGLKPSAIKDISESSITSRATQLAFEKLSPAHFQVLTTSFKKETVDTALDRLNKFEVKDLKRISKENPQLVKWGFTTKPGQVTLNWSKRFPKFKIP